MDFTQSLKAKAQRIIELSEQLAERAHTWNQEESAPSSGYDDRAGFIVYDDITLLADVYSSLDESESKLRARLAWSPKSENQEFFTIITLDFEANTAKTKALVNKSDDLTRQEIIKLLNEGETKPILIHVSLEAGIGIDGKTKGKRYEYKGDEMQKLTEKDKSEFIKTLVEAFDFIVTKIYSS